MSYFSLYFLDNFSALFGRHLVRVHEVRSEVPDIESAAWTLEQHREVDVAHVSIEGVSHREEVTADLTLVAVLGVNLPDVARVLAVAAATRLAVFGFLRQALVDPLVVVLGRWLLSVADGGYW